MGLVMVKLMGLPMLSRCKTVQGAFNHGNVVARWSKDVCRFNHGKVSVRQS